MLVYAFSDSSSHLGCFHANFQLSAAATLRSLRPLYRQLFNIPPTAVLELAVAQRDENSLLHLLCCTAFVSLFVFPCRFSHKEYMTAEDLKAFLETEQGVR